MDRFAMRAAPALLGVLSALGSPATAQGPAPSAEVAPSAARAGLGVGVVDLAKVLAAYPRAIQERKKVDDFVKEWQAAMDSEQRKLNELKLQRDDLQKGTIERDFKELALNAQLRALDGMNEVYARERERRVEQYYALMLDDMERAIAIVAKDRGLPLVLRIHAELFDGSAAAKSRVFESRIVWFAADEIDVTAAVIQRLQAPLPEAPAKGDRKGAEPNAKDNEAPKQSTGKPGN